MSTSGTKRAKPSVKSDQAPPGVPYVPHTARDIVGMLETIGVAQLDDLFRQVPERLRSEAAIDLPGPLPEPEVRARIEALADQNRTTGTLCFAGGGFYPHWIPEAVDKLMLRSEFATAYTPYQPEVSQGTLQATFEFQSLIAMLFGLEIANGSMYDGASAAAEAVLMAGRVLAGRRRVWVSRGVHPHYRRVMATYTAGLDIEYRELPFRADGRTDLKDLDDASMEEVACVVMGYPNVFGVLEDVSTAASMTHAGGALLVTTTAEPISLGLCQPPGALGADIAVGEGQSLGLPLSYGGPGIGLFAVRERFVRHMPGRVVGATVDSQGRRGYVLTLATREQHIRRERATSNICTNQALCAIGVAIYLSLLGKHGLHELAALNYSRAHKAAARLIAAGGRLRFGAPFFNEFVIQIPDTRARWERLAAEGIMAGFPLDEWYPELRDCLLVSVTEVHRMEDIEKLVAGLGAQGGSHAAG